MESRSLPFTTYFAMTNAKQALPLRNSFIFIDNFLFMKYKIITNKRGILKKEKVKMSSCLGNTPN